MHKLLLLCSSIFFSPMINGMDQHPAPSNFALIFNESLTKEINEVIFNHAIISIHEELHPAAKIISTLAQVNKAINHHINDKNNCLTYIKILARRFKTSHINVCAQIQTPAARQRFLLQNQLFFMCVAERLDKKTANILIRE